MTVVMVALLVVVVVVVVSVPLYTPVAVGGAATRILLVICKSEARFKSFSTKISLRLLATLWLTA